jgi:hypothetical protein
MSEDDDLGQLLLSSPSSFHRSPPPAAHTDRILLSSSTAAIRARRLAQLQSSGGGGGGPSRGGGRGPSPGGGGGGGPGGDEKMSPEEQAAQKAAEEEQMRTIMATVLEPGARERRSSLPSRLFFLLPPSFVSSFSYSSLFLILRESTDTPPSNISVPSSLPNQPHPPPTLASSPIDPSPHGPVRPTPREGIGRATGGAAGAGPGNGEWSCGRRGFRRERREDHRSFRTFAFFRSLRVASCRGDSSERQGKAC